MQTFRRVAGFRFWTVPALALMLALGAGACYEDYNLDYEDYDTALTVYDNTVSFGAYRYFIMPDTIIHIYDTTKTDPLAAARKYDDQILSLVRSNFIARGYQDLGNDSTAIPPGINKSEVMAVFIGQFAIEYTGYYYNYWYGYWGYWWGYYPPYYPPDYVATYDYTTGTTAIEAVDYGKSVSDRRVKPLWLGTVSGLTGDTPSSVQQRLNTNINQLFLQSPYLFAGQ